MQWGNFRRSSNVEIAQRGSGGGGGGFRIGGGKLGIGAVVIVLLASWGLGIDPSVLMGALTGEDTGGYSDSPSSPQTQSYNENSPQGQTQQGQTTAANYPDAPFVAAVLGETEDRWAEILAPHGVTYEAPKLVLFSGVTRSACGTAASAMGPFYCPNDRRIYLDTEFFDEIQTKLGGCKAGSKSCEFSEAYVIAHEVGHHVQNLLGILPKAEAAEARASDTEANRIQVRVELQADCFAGLWANKAQAKWNFLEDGDVDAALQTATAIGDDTLQKRAQDYVVPDAFTHGTAAQRKHWFVTGLKGGSIESCDTFAADAP